MKSALVDGGGIYSNMPSPSSYVAWNHLYDIGYLGQRSVWQLYFDSGVRGQNIVWNAALVDGSASSASWIHVKWSGNAINSNYSTTHEEIFCGRDGAPACCGQGGAPACETGGTNVVQYNTYWPTPYPAWVNSLMVQGCADGSNTCAGIESSYQYISSLSP